VAPSPKGKYTRHEEKGRHTGIHGNRRRPHAGDDGGTGRKKQQRANEVKTSSTQIYEGRHSTKRNTTKTKPAQFRRQ
jgi:hypothetical protein